MAAQLPTVLCIMAAALIHLPDAQSRTTQPARYDAARVQSCTLSYLSYRICRQPFMANNRSVPAIDEAQSTMRPKQCDDRRDSEQELTEKFDEKYYLVQRSHYIDRKMGNSASCVSVLKLTPLFGQSGITAQVSIKANRYSDPVTNKEWKMVAYTPAGSGTKYMIQTTDHETAELLYTQELVFSDYVSCRVLVHMADGDKHCQLWVIHSAVTGSVPRGCQQAYDQHCQTAHTIFRRECLQ